MGPRGTARFEELDWRPTPLGDLTLRRRRDPVSDADVFEIKLGDDFLMSSFFTVAEVAVADLALAALTDLAGPDRAGPGFEIAVGGLGLGYTAQAVLSHPAVGALVVVEKLGPVIDWHRRGLLPLGPALTGDARCRLVEGDFFAMITGAGLDPEQPDRPFDAIVLDIDHSPRHVLHPSHADFYAPTGTRRLAQRLRPDGVFALWSNDPPDDGYLALLGEVFADVRAEVVRFPNPLQDREATNTVYVAARVRA